MRRAVIGLGLLVLGGCSSSTTTPASNESEAGAPADTVGTPGLREPTVAGPVEPEPHNDDPVLCQAALHPSAELVHQCVLLNACLPAWVHYGGSSIDQFTEGFQLSDCIAFDLPHATPMLDCAEQATGCEAVSRCGGGGYYEKACPLEPERARFCDGTRMVDCAYVLPAQYLDCARLGARCIEFEADGAQAVDCAVDSVCGDTDDDVSHCDGSKIVQCRGGVAHGQDCASQGMDCAEDADGAACIEVLSNDCEPSAPECAADGSVSFCGDDGKPIHVDCSSSGLSCALHPPTETDYGFDCRAPDCDDQAMARCVEECAGPIARLCVGGARFEVDCREHGFDYCQTFVGPNGPTAQCGVPISGGFSAEQ